MSASTEAASGYDPNIPQTTHEGLAAALYGKVLASAESVLDVAAGYTDLGADLRRRQIMKPQVISLDAMEGYDTRGHHPNRVHGYAQALPFEDGRFSMTVCQYGAQHMPDDVLAPALTEMVRVTQTADSGRDGTKGVILVGPVFRRKRLENAIASSGLHEFMGTMYHETKRTDDEPSLLTLEDRKRTVHPSLWIHKLPELTPAHLQQIRDLVIETDALKPPRREIGEVVSRIFGGFSWR